jgi:hypothetical protein
MKIYYTPDKKPWEIWKRNRYLKPEKDYLIENQRIVFGIPIKGKLEFEYK